MFEPDRPPATKIAWRVWVRERPAISVEVSEQFWIDARVLGACKISELEHRAVFFDELEAVPSDSNVVHLELERLRRDARSPAAIR